MTGYQEAARAVWAAFTLTVFLVESAGSGWIDRAGYSSEPHLNFPVEIVLGDGSLEAPSEPSNRDGGSSAPKASAREALFEIREPHGQKIFQLTLLLLIALGFGAYVYVDGRKYKKPKR